MELLAKIGMKSAAMHAALVGILAYELKWDEPPYRMIGSRFDLEICIPTWNSHLFLRQCLLQIAKTCTGLRHRVTILDNESTDQTAAIAREMGCRVIVKKCSMPDALNILLKLSRGETTLFMHADTILLNPNWFALATKHLNDKCILVSPQDIGCGPYSRPAGKNKPESSFMLFDTSRLRRTRQLRWVRRFRLPFFPQRIVNFYSGNVTHYIPDVLLAKGFTWKPMQVHLSNEEPQVLFTDAQVQPGEHWDDSMAKLRYGLGNFYSIDGTMTHYHNWYDRILGSHPECKEKSRIPVDYIRERTLQFLHDFETNSIVVPQPLSQEREPQEIPLFKGNRVQSGL
ncbi:MAG: glycosyltransferase family 2 protein [Synechococcaceae cyanobacterium]